MKPPIQEPVSARPESPLSTKTNKLTMTPAALSALAKGDLENFMAASIPGGIERQEKQGQITESFRETLPIDGTIKSRRGEDNKAQFESVGFVFGAPADDLFVNVKFPEGWKKVPTEHSMWTDIVDHKGRKRGAIFYKAAFYDRSAHCHLTRRFDVTQTYGDGTTNETAYIADACGEVNQRIEGLKRPDYNDRAEAQRRNAAMDEAKTKLRAWLKENFPNYESPTAYWE